MRAGTRCAPGQPSVRASRSLRRAVRTARCSGCGHHGLVTADPASSTDSTDLVFRPVREAADARALIAVLDDVWGDAHLAPNLVLALAHAGNYAFVIEQDGRPTAAGLGFFGSPDARTMHSHVVGVRAGRHGGGVGAAVKRHQRGWCLDRGADAITWTYDPLVSRNAYFNLEKLGADLDEYLVDFYGPMDDGRNAGDETDRALVRWRLDAPRRPGASGGEPEPAEACAHGNRAGTRPLAVVEALAVDDDGAPVLLDADDPSLAARRPGVAAPRALRLGIPLDIEGLRAERPDLAREWRRALRDALAPRLAAGWRVAGFDRAGGYLLTPPNEPEDPRPCA